MNGKPTLLWSEVLHVMETILLDPEAVLANEAFPRDSPRPDFWGTLNRIRAPFPSPDNVENWGWARLLKYLTQFSHYDTKFPFRKHIFSLLNLSQE